MPLDRTTTQRGLRSAVAGLVVAGAFWALSVARIPLPSLDFSCGASADCLGGLLLGILVVAVLVTVAAFAGAVLLGWAVLTLLRVRRALLVALAGPLALIGLGAVLGGLGLSVLRPSVPAVVLSGVSYALAGLAIRDHAA